MYCYEWSWLTVVELTFWWQYSRHTLEIYSRVIGLTHLRPLDLTDIMYHVLSSVPTSIFDRNCGINIAASTSSPKTGYRIQNQQDQLNTRQICDWCVCTWVIHWPTIGNLKIYTMVFRHTCNAKQLHKQCFLRVWQVLPMQQKGQCMN